MAEQGSRRESGADRVHAVLTELIAPALTEAGFVLEELRLTPAGKHRVLRVLVDRAEPHPSAEATEPADAAAPVPGLSLDEVAQASRTVSSTLDGVSGAADPLGSTPYTLEVSSPGVDRALTLPRHFRRNVGRLVVLRTAGGEDVTGRIARGDDDDVVLATEVGERAVAWDQVVSGQVQVEFTRRGPAPDEPTDEYDDDGDDDDGDDDDEHDEDSDDDDEDEEG